MLFLNKKNYIRFQSSDEINTDRYISVPINDIMDYLSTNKNIHEIFYKNKSYRLFINVKKRFNISDIGLSLLCIV